MLSSVNYPWGIQLDDDGRLRHLLTIEGLSAALLTRIMDLADRFASPEGLAPLPKVNTLLGKTVVNLFFESSTRTRTTFEVAAKKLSADVLNLNVATSATNKGETLLDTVRTLQDMHADMFVVRHPDSGAAYFIARHVAPHVSVLNAGDGRHAHPTQALLDLYTIRRHKGDFTRLSVAIVGDILHSRVARSQIHALNLLNTAEVRVVAPATLLPKHVDTLGVQRFTDLNEGIRGVDVIMMLRLQNERMSGALLPSELEFFRTYGLSESRLALARPDVIVMHPGPINRGVEIESAVADGPHSLIDEQVSHGIAIRMAIMSLCMGELDSEVTV